MNRILFLVVNSDDDEFGSRLNYTIQFLDVISINLSCSLIGTCIKAVVADIFCTAEQIITPSWAGL